MNKCNYELIYELVSLVNYNVIIARITWIVSLQGL